VFYSIVVCIITQKWQKNSEKDIKMAKKWGKTLFLGLGLS
jgi:hypothetical protein